MEFEYFWTLSCEKSWTKKIRIYWKRWIPFEYMSFECWWGHTSVSNGLYEGCITSDKERDLQEIQHWSLADCVDNCMPYLDLLLLYWLGFLKSSEIGRLRQYWSTINRLLRWCSGFLPSLITNFHLNDARWWRITKVLMS